MPSPNPHNLVEQHTDNFKRLAGVSMTLQDTMETIMLFAHDGYPTSTPLSSDPPRSTPTVLDGPCPEPGPPRWGFRGVEWGKWSQSCGKERPCPEHDVAVHLTTVERNGNPTPYDLRLIATAENKITSALADLETVISRNGKQKPAPTPCTTGSGREGHSTTKHPDGQTWGDPLCRNIPDPRCSGMCIVCFHDRMNPWRITHGLEPIPMSEGTMCKRCGVRESDRSDGLCNADRLRESRQRRAS